MGVYIDQMNMPFRNMIMNHMMADTHEELVNMAKKIGVHQKWIQDAGTEREHFDVCLSKKARALALGATEVGRKKIYELMESKRLHMASREKCAVLEIDEIIAEHREQVHIEHDFYTEPKK